MSLKLEITGSRARVVLNRPEVRNAFDEALIAELHQTARDLAANERVRVVELSGEGKVFSAGADLNWMQRMAGYGQEENLRDATETAAMFEAWDTLPKPVVGRIHGAAIGGGTGLVAVCDLAVASSATVFAFSEVRLGLLPAVISPFVRNRIGAAARGLFLTGERFSALRALDIGLVDRVVAPEELEAEVDAAVEAILAGGPEAQAAVKRLLRETAGFSPEEAGPATARAIAEARARAEGREGMRAFLEKRRASWREDA